jgi:hypothetical protein
VDYATNLLAQGRERVTVEHLDVTFLEGDIHALPVPDASAESAPVGNARAGRSRRPRGTATPRCGAGTRRARCDMREYRHRRGSLSCPPGG